MASSDAIALPPLAGTYQPTPEQIADYQRDGHVLLRGLVSPAEIAAWRSTIVEAVNRLDAEKQRMEQIVQGKAQGWKFVQNLWEQDERVKPFVLSERFGRAAADLMGVDTVRLFRDQSYFKEPGGGNTSWHQDAYFMPLDTQNVITLWLPLIDITEEMAPMRYFSGTHKGGYLGTSSPQREAIDRFETHLTGKGYPVHSYGAVNAGDGTFHSGWTMHGSLMNTSPHTREALVIVFYEDGARAYLPPLPLIPFPEEMQARRVRNENLAYILGGIAPGEIAASSRNPIVYQRS